jgi:uncharacterized protein YciI
MRLLSSVIAATIFSLASISAVQAQSAEQPKNPGFDAALAGKLGADKIGMKNYVLAILKTGPANIAAGKERDDIFKGHFANIHRLADEGKLVVAGPFGDDGVDWRGMFIFNVETIEEAQKLTATDPVLKSGLMVAEFHKLYCSAALMEVNNIHKKIAKENF